MGKNQIEATIKTNDKTYKHHFGNVNKNYMRPIHKERVFNPFYEWYSSSIDVDVTLLSFTVSVSNICQMNGVNERVNGISFINAFVFSFPGLKFIHSPAPV